MWTAGMLYLLSALALAEPSVESAYDDGLNTFLWITLSRVATMPYSNKKTFHIISLDFWASLLGNREPAPAQTARDLLT